MKYDYDVTGDAGKNNTIVQNTIRQSTINCFGHVAINSYG